MVDLRQLLHNDVSHSPHPDFTVIQGYVSMQRTPPATFASPMWVTVESHGTNVVWGPFTWPAIHGSTLPVAGNPVTLGIDEYGTPHVVAWDATYVAPLPGGTAGGDLTGTYPNPTVAWGGAGHLAWAAPAKCYRNAAYTTVNGWNLAYYDTVTFDPGSNLDHSSGSYLYKVPATGYYQLNARSGCNSTFRTIVEFDTMTSTGVTNEAIVDGEDITPAAGGTPASVLASVEYLTGGTWVCTRTFVGGVGVLATGAASTFMSIARVA